MRPRGWWCLTLVAVTACSTTGEGPDPAAPAVPYAGDLHVQLWILGEANYAVFYEVNGERTIGFGGGQDALVPRLGWTGTMTPQQFELLRTLLARHGWLDGSLTATGEPARRITRIQLRWSGGSRRYTLTGRSAGVEPVAALLGEAARARLDADLDVLPLPGAPAGR